MLKTVHIRNLRRGLGGLKANHAGYPSKPIRVFGADTETVRGRLHTFQVASEGEETLQYVDPATGFPALMRWVDARVLEKGLNLMFFHNLKFDATVLFEANHATLYDQYNEIRFTRDGYQIQMFYGRVNCATLRRFNGEYQCPRCGAVPEMGVRATDRGFYCRNPQHGDPVKVKPILGPVIKWLDSSAFCPPGQKSLAAALQIYGVPYTKTVAPEGLGEQALRGPAFERYAMNDARAVESLGLSILKVHKQYDITPCLSLPQLSGKILRHHFFKPNETFPYPPEQCRLAAELSYHAGKNGFYAPRGVYENVYEYDINSAFPCAMVEMPQIVQGTYRHVRGYRAGYLGIYRVRGRFTGRYPLVFDAGFKPVRGLYQDEWITGYELELLQRYRSGKRGENWFTVVEGWIWRHKKRYRHSPLKEFVNKFWDLKSKAPKGPERDTYKNILNSLYGKFAACVEQRQTIETASGVKTLSGSEKTYLSGALYHPFIATQITGYVRARLWELETRGEALHAATDSIKSHLDLPSSNGLGGIKKEVYGRCYLFRNKLYLHFAKDTTLCGHALERGWLPIYAEDQARLEPVGRELRTGYARDPQDDRVWGKVFEPDGQHLCKVGLHGFKGSLYTLYAQRETLLKQGYLDYDYNHMTQLREATLRGEPVCTMTRRRERITLVGSK